jgi:hypothetical protein
MIFEVFVAVKIHINVFIVKLEAVCFFKNTGSHLALYLTQKTYIVGFAFSGMC